MSEAVWFYNDVDFSHADAEAATSVQWRVRGQVDALTTCARGTDCPGSLRPGRVGRQLGQPVNRPGGGHPGDLREHRFGPQIPGEVLDGDPVLEAPSQLRAVPQEVPDDAAERQVTLRTVEGEVLMP